MKKNITITNENGLHARPAGVFVKEASRYCSDIFIEFKGNKCNGKSIMNVMCLGLKKDDEIDLIVEGRDEERAMDKLVELFENNFGER